MHPSSLTADQQADIARMLAADRAVRDIDRGMRRAAWKHAMRRRELSGQPTCRACLREYHSRPPARRTCARRRGAGRPATRRTSRSTRAGPGGDPPPAEDGDPAGVAAPATAGGAT